MSFNENLEKAKSGNKRNYGYLCNDYADRLYAVAFLVLNSETDAAEAVENGFEDGFKGIDRINDSNHLCAWLTRELTKHIVARLKEYRADNITVSDGNIPEKKIFCRLSDLDRLVCALNLTFGYKSKEISVIAGLKEETAERKLNDSAKKLGNDLSAVKSYISTVKAPDYLITKQPRVHDLTVEIDHSDNDDMIGEMERIAAIAEAEEKAMTSEKTTEVPENSSKFIRFQPDSSDEVKEKKPEKKDIPKKAEINIAPPEVKDDWFPLKGFDEEKRQTKAPKFDPSRWYDPKEEPTPKTSSKSKPKPKSGFRHEPISEFDVKAKTEPAPEPETKQVPEPVAKHPSEPVTEQTSTEEKPREIDAKTFINVITAQRIKGSDFLKLMGNTKISNSVYREIEQNPNLTKERLVELLEGSPLTSEDYYKILTAVKQRNELLSKKEEAERKQQQAGLFSINRREEKTEKETETKHTSGDTLAFASNDVVALQKKEDDEKPFTPDVSEKAFVPRFNEDPEDYDDEEDDEDTADKPTFQPATKLPEPPKATDPETGKRQRYKGREYFIDDDVYYPGVNNGKLACWAVMAIILVAVSFAVRYFTTGSLIPTENSLPAINREEDAKLPAEYLSNDDIYTAISMLETSKIRNESVYLKADGSAYSENITNDFAEDGSRLYILRENRILVYDLSSDNPNSLSVFPVDESRDFMGFSAADGKLFVLYKGIHTDNFSYTVSDTAEDGTVTTEEKGAETSRNEITVECYDENLNPVYSYSQDGDFVGVRTNGSSATLVTAVNTAGAAVKEVSDTYLPSYNYGERKYISFDSVTVPEGIGCNGFTVIGTVNESEARVSAVLGGKNAYAEFDEDRIILTIPDKNLTIRETFSFVGMNLTSVSSESFKGECYGSGFINEGGNVITSYDSSLGCTMVQKKSGEDYLALSGIAPLETLKSVVYTDKYAYILTENAEKNDMLYCVDISGSELVAVEADKNAVYTEKLKAYGDELLGLTVEAKENGDRAGLKLSVYGYENGLTEKRSSLIRMDENTGAEYIKYLSADAEQNNLRIAADSGNDYIAVSTVYFDGISEIERMVFFKDNGETLSQVSDLLLFDIQSDYRFLTYLDNLLYVVTDSAVITVSPETGKAQGYYTDEPESAESETQEETDEEAAIE